MPTAEHFSTIGRGNGFPFCCAKVDVSGFDYWMTLGGTQKGNAPTPSEIALSLTNAMHLFWNVYSVTGSAMGQEYPGSPDVTAFTNQLVRVGLFLEDWSRYVSGGMETDSVDNSVTAKDPRDRVCSGQDGEYNKRFYMFESFSTVSLARTVVRTPRIVRMYDGDTGNENNFVGYGVESFYRFNDYNWDDWDTDSPDYRPLVDWEPSMWGEPPTGDAWMYEVGPFEASGRAFWDSSTSYWTYVTAIDSYLSYVPKGGYFSETTFNSTYTLGINYTTFSGMPMIRVQFNARADLVAAEVTGVDFYDYGTP